MLQQEQAAATRGHGGLAPLPAGGGTSSAAPLNTLPAQTQQVLLMRDLLLVLAGVEGQYIRVAAAAAATEGGAEGNGDRLRRSEAALAATLRGGAGAAGTVPKISEAHFLIDLDTADRSVANQVSNQLI